MIIKNVAFIGGDKRQLFAAETFANAGFNVYLAGFDKIKNYGDLMLADISSALGKADIAVLPVTGIKGNVIPSVFSDKELKLSEDTIDILKSKPVFMGKADTLKNFCKNIEVFDILEREDFAVANALPTAEGAVQVAMENYEGLISGSKCLVIGYGRIGKILSRMLNALNADVTVSARKPWHLAYICSDGNKAVCTGDIQSLAGYDIVFNTIPKLIIDKKVLENSNSDTLIIDLASLPGGVDFDSAKKLNINTIHALALPGKCAPAAAGKIIFDTILTILKEEYRWQRQI